MKKSKAKEHKTRLRSFDKPAEKKYDDTNTTREPEDKSKIEVTRISLKNRHKYRYGIDDLLL